MCTGVELALLGTAVAASAGGMYAKNQQAEAQQDAMKKAAANYDSRLNDVQGQSSQELAKVLAGFDKGKQEQQMADVEKQRSDSITQSLVPVASAGDLAPKSASTVVSSAYDKAANDAYSKGIEHGQNAAALGAWGQNRFLNDIALQSSGSKIATLSNYAQGWGPVYQAEMAGAQNAGDGWGTLGSVLSGVGMAAGAAGGLSAAGAFGSGAAGAGGAAAGGGAGALAGGTAGGDAASLAAASSIANAGTTPALAAGANAAAAASNPWLSAAFMAPGMMNNFGGQYMYPQRTGYRY